MNNLIPKTILNVIMVSSCVYCWTVDGTVSSNKGGLLSGVIASVVDSTFADTTDALGKFSLQNLTPTSIRQSQVSSTNGIEAKISGNMLIIQSSHTGSADISIIDLQGKVLWNQSVVLGMSSLHISIPTNILIGSNLIRIKENDNRTIIPSQIESRVLALASPSFPKLLFHKQGYQDTTYNMTSTAATGVSIILRDTATAITTCPTQKLSTSDNTRNVVINGASRSYILHVPSTYKGNSAVPLIVDFHPLTGSGSQELGASPYKAVTDPEGVITAYPNGLSGPAGGAWNVGPCCVSGANDTAFARAIVADVEKVACINPKRVYAVGFSMGGGMTHYSACHLADIFAAVAPAAFDLLQENVSACKPSRPLSVISFRSTGDPTVTYDGGYSNAVTGMPINFLGAKATFLKWSQINQCTGSPSTEDANGCSTYSSCASGVQVTLCSKKGGGHDYGNATVAWPLLKKYTLP